LINVVPQAPKTKLILFNDDSPNPDPLERRTEEALRRSLSLLRATLDSTADGILVVDREGKVTSFNRKFLSLWKIPQSLAARGDDGQLLQSVLEQIRDPEAFLAKVHDLCSRPEVESNDVLEFRDGRVFERSSKPQRIGKEIVGRVWSFRDVTEQRRAEEALQRSEYNYRLLADNATDTIWMMDLNFHSTHISPSVTRLRGYSVEEAMAQKIEEIITPDSLQVVKAFFAEALATKKEKGTHPSRPPALELEVYCKNGSKIWTESTITFLREPDGLPVQILGVTRDITRRKMAEEALRRSEEKYRLVIQNSNDAIFIAQDGVIKFPNPKAEDLLGYSAEELATIPFINHIHPDDRSIVIENHKRRLQGQSLPSTYSFRSTNKSGEDLWVEINAVRILWDGRPATIVKGQATVLLVDDEEMILQVNRMILEKLGYKVFAVRSGEEAVKVFQSQKGSIDLVLMDMIMPGMEGGEVLDHLQKIQPGVKVLLLSGYGMNDEVARIMEGGCLGFIQKPFDIGNFSRKIRKVLGMTCAESSPTQA
jgi:two-component system, sensor histidine kinase and response regulator